MRSEEQAVRVLQDRQGPLRQRRIRGIDVGQLDVPVLQSLDCQWPARILDRREIDAHAVGLSQAHRPVGARLKLRVAAQDQRAYPRQVADGGHRMLRREG